MDWSSQFRQWQQVLARRDRAEAEEVFGNAGSIKYFVLPCLESLGVNLVNEWFSARAAHDSQVKEKAEMAEYWYRASGKAGR